ncbi:MAG TPA: ABC transporter permease [Flavobacteriales bacterium]|nr:ABC transporter permease [Flavobacteriales bacterium]
MIAAHVAAIFARNSIARSASPVGFPYFIARRIVRGSGPRSSNFSKPIVFIAVLGIVVGMAVMVLTVGVTQGFQREVRAKVTGAGSHLQITAIGQSDPKETIRVPIDQPFYPWLDTVKGVAHIQVYATRPGIIETENDIEGVVLKGIGKDYDASFMRSHLLAGDMPAIGDSARPIDLLLSSFHADRLRIAVDDTITTYLVRGKEDIRPRKFRVCGVYKTGLEQIDRNLVFVDIDHLQKFAQWGLKAELGVSELKEGRFVDIEGFAFGGDRDYSYEWIGAELKGKGPHRINVVEHMPFDGTAFQLKLVVHDQDGTIPDTAWVALKCAPIHANFTNAQFGGSVLGPWRADSLFVERGGSGGSYNKYCGGFEVSLNNFDDLLAMDDLVYKEYLPLGLRSLSVKDRFPEIFSWLELLDKNVIVILVLMVLVSIINMTSALLIIILERTNMIGALKALGARNGTIRRVFLINAAYILGTGILLGDVLGIGLALVQKQFGIITLPVETYYVDVVAIDIDPLSILWLNLGTMGVCVLALLLPSALVTRIAPAKAIRFA